MKSASLRRRTALAFTLWIAIFQVLAFSVSAWLVLWPVLRASASDLAGIMILSARSWAELPVDRQLVLQESLAQDQALTLSPAKGLPPGRPSYLPYARLLEQDLTARTGAPALVRWDSSSQLYRADIQIQGLHLHYSFPRSRIGTNPPLATLVVLASSLLLAWMASRWVSRSLTAPLAALESAAQAVGCGETPAVPAESGVRELDGLTRQFNAMAHQVREFSRNRTTILAGVSHDLRGPLTRLRMALELARSHPEPALLDSMERYLSQMDTLVEDFLDYSRGISTRSIEPVALGSWLDHLAQDMGAINTCTENPTVGIDPSALRRVLSNLIQNAHRHAPGASPELRCTFSEQGINLEVLDRGPGIPEGETDTVFEPFVRLDPARTSPGSGLGLAVVREVCRSHGWAIELRNRPEGGLTARLFIPWRG